MSVQIPSSLRRAAALVALVAAPLGAQSHAGHGGAPSHEGHAQPAATKPAPAKPAAARRQSAGAAVVGTLIVAHGGGPSWDGQVTAMAEAVRTGGPVEVSFLMGPGAKAHAFQDAARRLVERGATEIVVVPLLVSSHSGHYDQIRYLAGQLDTLGETMMHHLHMSGITRADVDVPLHVTRAIDESPDAARVLAARAIEMVPSAEERATRALFLLGHGPNDAEDYAAWMKNLRQVADTVRAATGFRSVLLELVRDDAPAEVRAEAVTRTRELIRLQHELTGKDVIVVPILVSTGSVSREKFPRDLAGLPVEYRGDALLPHAGMARWVEARVRDCGASRGSPTSELAGEPRMCADERGLMPRSGALPQRRHPEPSAAPNDGRPERAQRAKDLLVGTRGRVSSRPQPRFPSAVPLAVQSRRAVPP